MNSSVSSHLLCGYKVMTTWSHDQFTSLPWVGRSLGYSEYRTAGVPCLLPENATFLGTIWVAVKIQTDDRSTPFTAERGKTSKGNRTQPLGAGPLGEDCPGYIHTCLQNFRLLEEVKRWSLACLQSSAASACQLLSLLPSLVVSSLPKGKTPALPP